MSVIGLIKSQVFKRRLKASVEEVAVLRSVDRLFQALGAATENALSRNRRLVRGTTQFPFAAMRNVVNDRSLAAGFNMFLM